MNLLAHAYLSFHHPQILVGNMSSDFIKGKKQFEFSEGVQKGIRLHRDIDTFTDDHEITALVKSFFRPAYRLYSGAFADVVYDHFLANDPQHFTDESLQYFAQQVYTVLLQNQLVLPQKLGQMLPYMQAQNWLYNYKYNWGIKNSFAGLVRRSAYLTESEIAFEVFEKNYSSLQQAYQVFFPALFAFTKNRYALLLQIDNEG